MENLLSYVEFIRWTISPAGLLLVLTISGLLLSGIPGAILPKVEATARVRPFAQQDELPRPDATADFHREKMEA